VAGAKCTVGSCCGRLQHEPSAQLVGEKHSLPPRGQGVLSGPRRLLHGRIRFLDKASLREDLSCKTSTQLGDMPLSFTVKLDQLADEACFCPVVG
jgi:hypothetical protein